MLRAILAMLARSHLSVSSRSSTMRSATIKIVLGGYIKLALQLQFNERSRSQERGVIEVGARRRSGGGGGVGNGEGVCAVVWHAVRPKQQVSYSLYLFTDS